MKKIILLILVAIVPFLTMAQKRSKKNTKTEKISSSSTYEFMVIIGSEIKSSKPNNKTGKLAPMRTGMLSKVRLNFDFGNIKSKENLSLIKKSETFRTMADAVNAAANLGWYFHSANVIDSKQVKSIIII